jgi:hypothetical protein
MHFARDRFGARRAIELGALTISQHTPLAIARSRSENARAR